MFCKNGKRYTAISIKVVPEQSGKVEYEGEKLAGSNDKKYTNRTKFNFLGNLVALYIYKETRSNFKLS